jgi:hypothetical protein
MSYKEECIVKNKRHIDYNIYLFINTKSGGWAAKGFIELHITQHSQSDEDIWV